MARHFNLPGHSHEHMEICGIYLHLGNNETRKRKEQRLGTHWVCWRNIDKNVCEYFDSFGLSIPFEVEKYLSKSGKTLFYSPDEIQERLSVLCGYWCLYYLLERQNDKEMFEVLHNPEFNPNNQMVNYNFLKKYFNIK